MVLGRPWNVTNGSEGSKQTYLFREEKKRPLEEAECEEMEFLCGILKNHGSTTRGSTHPSAAFCHKPIGVGIKMVGP